MYHGGIVLLAAERKKYVTDAWGREVVEGSCLLLILSWDCWRNHLVFLLGAQMMLCLGARKKGTLYNAETGKREQELGCP